MNNQIIFLYTLAIVMAAFAVINQIILIVNANKVAEITGTIVEIQTAVPKQMPANSQWARVRYFINGQSYTSSNRVQVSMNSQLGDSVTVKYYKSNPNTLYNHSSKLSIVFICASEFFLFIAFANSL